MWVLSSQNTSIELGSLQLPLGLEEVAHLVLKIRAGWYAGMVNFGWLQVGAGVQYSGKNLGFAQKAMSAAKMKVNVRFKRVFAQKVDAEMKKLKFGQRLGMR